MKYDIKVHNTSNRTLVCKIKTINKHYCIAVLLSGLLFGNSVNGAPSELALAKRTMKKTAPEAFPKEYLVSSIYDMTHTTTLVELKKINPKQYKVELLFSDGSL